MFGEFLSTYHTNNSDHSFFRESDHLENLEQFLVYIERLWELIRNVKDNCNSKTIQHHMQSLDIPVDDDDKGTEIK